MDIPTNTSLLNDKHYIENLNSNSSSSSNSSSNNTEKKINEVNEQANLDLIDKMKEDTFLKLNLNVLFEDFLLTWHKIIFDLLNPDIYTIDDSDKWWDSLLIILKKILNIFLESNRLFYVGIGLIIISFFFYFILVTE